MAPEIDIHSLLQPTHGGRGFWLPTLTILAGAFAATWLGNVVVGKLMEPYASQLRKSLQAEDEVGSLRRGFSDGGKLIGMLERFLIFLFVFSGHVAGVGFLVAAKSVFRFGELSNQENRMEAEYITIGTLMSFSWGLLVALVTQTVAGASASLW